MICPYCDKDMEYIQEMHGELSEFGYSFPEPGYWECPFCGEIAYDNEYDDDFVIRGDYENTD